MPMPLNAQYAHIYTQVWATQRQPGNLTTDARNAASAGATAIYLIDVSYKLPGAASVAQELEMHDILTSRSLRSTTSH